MCKDSIFPVAALYALLYPWYANTLNDWKKNWVVEIKEWLIRIIIIIFLYTDRTIYHIQICIRLSLFVAHWEIIIRKNTTISGKQLKSRRSYYVSMSALRLRACEDIYRPSDLYRKWLSCIHLTHMEIIDFCKPTIVIQNTSIHIGYSFPRQPVS